jgi:trk system potassium uptake protein TrkA
VRRWQPPGLARTYCFVAREEFLDFEGDSRSLEQFGVDRIVWPEAQLAEDIERIIRVPDAIDAEVFADGAIRLLEYRIDRRSSIVDRRIADLHLPHGSLIVAVWRGESFFIPRGDSALVSGDKAIVMGTPDALGEVRRHITGHAEVQKQRVTRFSEGRDASNTKSRQETVALSAAPCVR